MNRLGLVNALLRRTIRPLWTPSTGVDRLRRVFRVGERIGTLGRRRPQVEHESIDGCAVEWIGNREHAARGMLVFVHGGAFALRGALGDRLLCADLARRSGLPVALLAYRLAPESPFPAALDDCTRLYRALLARAIPAGRIVLVGHSAGANLIAAMLMRARDAALPQPAGAALLSGCFDLTGPTPAALALAGRDVCASPDIWPWIARHYLGGADGRHPDASPLLGDWRGLAPLHFQVSDSEMLHDSVTACAARARAAGVEVSLTVWAGMPHFYPALDVLEQARLCRAAIVSFALAVLGAR